MLPAQYRMTRSVDFGITVRQGIRAAQPDLVVHTLRDGSVDDGPKFGLVVGKSVGNAVQRHRVSRRLRHVAYHLVVDDRVGLESTDRIVIRALPGSRAAHSARLESQLRSAVKRTQTARQVRS